MFDLREYHNEPRRLADLLLWAGLVAPGVIVTKTGHLQQTLRLRGPDLESATPAELLVLSTRINNVLKRLASGWGLFLEAQRLPAVAYPTSTWPEPLSRVLDDERRAQFAAEGSHFETHYYLTLTYLTPSERVHRLTRLLYEDVPDSNQVDYRATLAWFRDQVTRMTDLLAEVFPVLEPLTDAETLTYLHSTISTKCHPVAVPAFPMYLDVQLADMPLTGGVRPRLGASHLRTVTVRSFPGVTVPGMLDSLNHLGMTYRWTVRYLALDKPEALRLIRGYERKWLSHRKALLTLLRDAILQTESPMVNPEAVSKAADANAAYEALANDDVAFGYCTISVTVWDEDPVRADAKAHQVERAINGQGFVTHAEDLHAVKAWLGSHPGNVYANVRRPLLSTLNLAHLLPVSAVWAGPERNAHLDGPPLCYATSSASTPFRVVLHDQDVGHTLIVGPTGAGKSTALAFLALQFLRYPGAQVYLFDKGQSARAATLGVGGEWYALGEETAALAFQPLAAIDDIPERAWAAEWVEGLLVQEGVDMTPAVRDEVWQALGSLATAPVPQRTLTGLVHLLQHLALRQALTPYTLTGPHGHLLDADHDDLAEGTWQCFEMEHLMHTPRILPPVLTYLFHRLEQRFREGVPSLLVLDEAWVFLDHPLFAARIREWLKVLRKRNTSVIFSTQSLADVHQSPIAAAINESCPTRLFLPNPRALEATMAQYYRRYGLNDRQMALLAMATPKRQYYFQGRQGNRLFDLELGPIALAFCGAGSPEDLAQMTIVSQDTTCWFPAAWLAYKGLTGAAARLHDAQRSDDHATTHTVHAHDHRQRALPPDPAGATSNGDAAIPGDRCGQSSAKHVKPD
jgi:type IV secretion system protein VirB4